MDVQIRRGDLQNLARDFRDAGRRDLGRDMLKALRAEVKPIVPQVRSAIRSSPSATGTQRSGKALEARPRGLRDAMARGVQMKASLTGIQAGVRLRIDARHFPDGEKHLPKYREGVMARWRAPSWGHDPWKTIQPVPRFYPTIRPHIPRVRAGVGRIYLEYVDRLGGP
jgi:hypothetical protein